jgi:hypothetical protein
MDKEYSTNALRIFTIAVNCISGFLFACSLSLITYDFYLYGVISIVTILMTPIALVSFLALLVTNAYAEKRDWESGRWGLKIFGVALILITFTSISYKVWLDSPAVLLHARFDGRSTIDLYLRKNMTAKCEENHMLGVNESYGNYRIKGDTLILENINIKYCGSVLVDTMLFEEDYIRFLIEYDRCGIENSRMAILTDRLNHN